MKAVILAGGKGTRLGDLSGVYPKSMLKIGDMPIIEHQIELLKRYNFNDIFILVNHLKDNIIEYIGDSKKLNVKITYFEEKEPLGTVGGIKEIEEYLKEDFLVVYGDVMISMDIIRLINFHNEKRSDCTLVLHPNNHPYDSDLVNIDQQCRVNAFFPKPHDESKYYRNLVSAGVYILSPLIFKYIHKGEKADFGKDVFPDIYKKINIYGYNTAEYLKDMGTPDRLEEVRTDYLSGKVLRLNYENKRPSIFMDRDGVLNKEKNFISKTEDLEIFDFTAEAIKAINSSDYLALIATNQSAVARNLCSIEQIEEIHNKLETDLGKYSAKIDSIYYCPHHPDKGYPEENKEYKIDCDCRKPKLGMFKQACNEHNIDVGSSYMIGDSERDILFGRNAGVETIGVMTGYGLRKTNVLPDYFFRDLLQSVNFIIKDPYRKHFDNIYQSIITYQLSLINYKLPVKPFVINIGGNSRTGKTNFTNYLKNNFLRKGLKVFVIELDKWIKSRETRKPEDDVYKRYRSDILNEDLYKLLISKQKVIVEGYEHYPEREVQPVEYKYNDEDIVIIEGVVALSFEKIRDYSNLKIFFETDKDSLKRRIYEFYRWKGEKDNYIEEVYNQRNRDEYQVIEKESIFADLIIKSFEI